MKSWSVQVFKFQSDQEGYKQRKTQDPWLSCWHMYSPIGMLNNHNVSCLFSCFSAVLLFFCNHCLHFFFLTYDFPLILIKVNWFERCGLRNDLFFALQALLLLQETPHLIVIPNDSYFMRFVVVICEVNMCTFQVDMSIFSLLIVRGWVLRHSSGLTIYSIWALMTSCANALSS